MAGKPEITERLALNGWIVEHPDRITYSAQDAFQTAHRLLRDLNVLPHSTGPSTIEELLSTIQDAKTKYVTRSGGKAWKWMARLSSRVMFYAQVMDIMAQHHPEYVSLAWGLLKLVFIGVMNHETLIKELTKALCRICEAVKHVELKLLLYPTEEMKNQVSDLYTHLVKFAIRAVKWYREPRLLHAVTSITRPYSLRFKDIVEDIHDTIRQVDRLALSMSQAEQRQILLKLDESRRASEAEQYQIRLELEATRRELQVTRATHAETSRLIIAELKMAIDGASHLQSSGLINTNRQLSEIQFSQIMTFLATSNFPSPDVVRNTLSTKRRLRLRQNPTPISLYHSPALQDWGASPASSQILVDGSIAKIHVLRDFAIDVIDLVSSANIPTVWALGTKTRSGDDFVANDVIKYLAWQILKANQTTMDERSVSLTARRFQSARTEREWFMLLGAVMEGLEQVCLVVDLDLVDELGEGEVPWLREFPRFFDGLRERNVKTVVKVLFFRATRGSEERRSVDETAHIHIPKRDSGRVRKVAGKRGRKSKRALMEALQSMCCDKASDSPRVTEDI